MFSQYVYISTAPGISADEVKAIQELSARNNAEKAITGILLYNGRNFLQLLEGETAKVDALVAKIEADPRHDGFSILHQAQLDERICPQWGMKWVKIAESVGIRRDLLDKDLPEGLEPHVRTMILNFAMLN